MKTRFIFILTFAFIFAFHSAGQTPKFTVVASYTVPGKASGLAFDGMHLYSGIYGSGGDAVFQIDTSNGNYSFYCSGPMDDAFGLTHDGQHLWTTDHHSASKPAQAIQFDASGTKLDTFDLITTYMSGIAYDNGDFWVAAYYNPDGAIYKVDNAGNILSQFPSPYAQPWDLCLQNEFLWIADYYNVTIDKVDTTGALIDSQASLADRPAGVVFDGKYLWYVAGPLNDSSTLYKVDLGIGPEPKIYFPVDNHDFGDVLIGDSAIWNAKVKNIGSADLVIDSIVFQLLMMPVYSNTTFPITILPGDSTKIEFVFKPYASGLLSETANVYSNTSGAPPLLTFAGNGTTVGLEDINKVNNVSIFPNPFSVGTVISFSINESQHVSVRIYNLLGEMIRDLKDEYIGKGDVKISWDACNKDGNRMPAGTYFCVIQTGNYAVDNKIILVD